jgi:hypothetical protein
MLLGLFGASILGEEAVPAARSAPQQVALQVRRLSGAGG